MNWKTKAFGMAICILTLQLFGIASGQNVLREFGVGLVFQPSPAANDVHCVRWVNSGRPEPGWSDEIIVTGPAREALQSLHILDRPYRPGHFYGNTVRRLHYRSQLLPSLPEIGYAWCAVFRF